MLLTIKSMIIQWYLNHPTISIVIGMAGMAGTADAPVAVIDGSGITEFIKAVGFLISSITALWGVYNQWLKIKSKNKEK